MYQTYEQIYITRRQNMHVLPLAVYQFYWSELLNLSFHPLTTLPVAGAVLFVYLLLWQDSAKLLLRDLYQSVPGSHMKVHNVL